MIEYITSRLLQSCIYMFFIRGGKFMKKYQEKFKNLLSLFFLFTLLFIMALGNLNVFAEEGELKTNEKEAITFNSPVATKNFTLKKVVSEKEEIVGDFDTFAQALEKIPQDDKEHQYVIYLNRDVMIPENESVIVKQHCNIRLTSGQNGPFTLTRKGPRWLTDAYDTTLVIDNITLDGNKDGGMMFITNGGHVILNKGAIIQNFATGSDSYGENIIHIGNGTLTINDGATIKDNTHNFTGNKKQSIISLDNDATLNINGGTFSNNQNKLYFGGLLLSFGTVNISGGTFTGNKAPNGGVIASMGKLNITGGIFENNNVTGSGGAIWASKDCSISKTTFNKNNAQWGGAAFVKGTTTIVDVTFSSNTAEKMGGAIYKAKIKNASDELKIEKTKFENNIAINDSSSTKGGAVFIDSGLTSLQKITDCTFLENGAAFGGGIYLSANSKLEVENSTFVKNVAGYGAGITTPAGGVTLDTTKSYLGIKGVTFKENEGYLGGALFTSLPTEISQSIFNKNSVKITANDDGNNPHSSGLGGAIYVMDNVTQIKACNFINNAAFGSGGAISINGVNRDDEGNIIGIKENIKVTISENSQFKDNVVEVGQGGAIYTIPYAYQNPITNPKAYQNLITEDTTLFIGNKSKAGKFNPPSNFAQFTNLKYDSKSDVKHETLMRESLLNNYDINYKNPSKVITYDTNGGKFSDGETIKTFEYNVNQKISILDAPSREGFTFDYWKGSKYQPGDSYTVVDSHTFLAQWKNESPILEVNNKTITVDEDIDLRTLIIKAIDKEDGKNLKDKVIIDKGTFDNKKVGKYTIKFSLSDKGGLSVTKQALVTVIEKHKPISKPNNKTKVPDTKTAVKVSDNNNNNDSKVLLYSASIVLLGLVIMGGKIKKA